MEESPYNHVEPIRQTSRCGLQMSVPNRNASVQSDHVSCEGMAMHGNPVIIPCTRVKLDLIKSRNIPFNGIFQGNIGNLPPSLALVKKKKKSQITPTPKDMGLSARRSGGGGAAQGHPNQSSGARSTTEFKPQANCRSEQMCTHLRAAPTCPVP